MLAGAFMAKGLLPARDRELVILRVAVRAACDYEYRQHIAIALDNGVTRAEITALAKREPGTRWSTADHCLIRFADALIDGFEVSEDLWQQATEWYSDDQLMELTMLIGFYRMLAGLMNSAGIPLETRSGPAANDHADA